MIDQYLKSKKYVIISLILVVSLLLVAFITVKVNENNKLKQWQPLTSEINLEYGDSKPISRDLFVRKDDIVEFISIDLDIPLVKPEEGQPFYELGIFDGILKVKAGRQEKEFDITVHVRDTVDPKILKFSDRITVPLGYNGNFSEFFAFEDVDDIKMNIDLHTINTNQVGQYKSKVEAKDGSNNVTSRDFFVEVVFNDNNTVKPPVIVEPGVPDKEDPVLKSHSDVSISEDIRFTIKRVADPTLSEGQERVETKGVLGRKEIVTRIYYENNVEVRREIIKETITKAPVDEVVYYGTKPEEEKVEGAFEDYPEGLYVFETYNVDSQEYARELYETSQQALLRGEDLVARGVIERYDHGTTSRNGVTYYYITFKRNT